MLKGWVPYAIIAGVAVLLIAVIVVLARLAWRRQARRLVLDLVTRREAISAALKMTDSVVARLAGGTVKELLAFTGSDSDDRRAVAEIGARMRIESAELAHLPLPKQLWGLADDLGNASTWLTREAGGVGDSAGDAALDALSALDLMPVRQALEAADAKIVALSKKYGLADRAVYGGGLYI